MKVYLDNCCYNRPYDDQSQTSVFLEAQAKMKVQAMVRAGSLQLVSSFILWYELSQNPFDLRRSAILQFLWGNTSEFVNDDPDGRIRAAAEDIMLTGVHAKDAFHLACALSADCEVFLTTDRRLLKYEDKRITVENPVDFILRMEV